MASGRLIGVMVKVADEPAPLRHFFAVGHENRAKAELTAIDRTMLTRPVGAWSPSAWSAS